MAQGCSAKKRSLPSPGRSGDRLQHPCNPECRISCDKKKKKNYEWVVLICKSHQSEQKMTSDLSLHVMDVKPGSQ